MYRRDRRTMTPAQRCAADRRAALCRLAGGGRSEAGQFASPTLSIRTELTGLTDLPRGTAGHPDRRAHPGCLPASSSRRRSSSRPTGASSPTAIAESFVDSFKDRADRRHRLVQQRPTPRESRPRLARQIRAPAPQHRRTLRTQERPRDPRNPVPRRTRSSSHAVRSDQRRSPTSATIADPHVAIVQRLSCPEQP